jgi:hypothetical protein
LPLSYTRIRQPAKELPNEQKHSTPTGIALAFVGIGFASMVVASISFTKKNKNLPTNTASLGTE